MKKLSPTRSPALSDLLKETVGSKLSDRKGDYADFEFKAVPKVASRNRRVGEVPCTNRLPETTRVLLQILQEQERLTVQEYTLNSVTFKVFVVEDTDL